MQGIDKDLARYLNHMHEHGYLEKIHAAVLAQLVTYGWIIVTVDEDFDEVILLTETGHIAVDIATGRIPATSTPAAAPQPGEYTAVEANNDPGTWIVETSDTMYHMGKFEAEILAKALTKEHAALRSQLTSVDKLQRELRAVEAELKWTQERRREDVPALLEAQKELEAARERIAALERQLDGERKLLVKVKAALKNPNEIMPTHRIAKALEIIENE